MEGNPPDNSPTPTSTIPEPGTFAAAPSPLPSAKSVTQPGMVSKFINRFKSPDAGQTVVSVTPPEPSIEPVQTPQASNPEPTAGPEGTEAQPQAQIEDTQPPGISWSQDAQSWSPPEPSISFPPGEIITAGHSGPSQVTTENTGSTESVATPPTPTSDPTPGESPKGSLMWTKDSRSWEPSHSPEVPDSDIAKLGEILQRLDPRIRLTKLDSIPQPEPENSTGPTTPSAEPNPAVSSTPAAENPMAQTESSQTTPPADTTTL